ncbi:MAG: hypothetical protein Q4F63_04115, partial [Clostridia bacterium]|nr:hypothetical protein [Clostridia bacterium]
MKLSLRRFLSGSLAMVMAVAGMTIGMATSAMAADHQYGTVNQTSANVKEWGFTTNMPTGSNQTLSAGDTVNGITFTDVTGGANLNKSGYLSAKAGVVFSVPVPANSTGTIYVKATSGNASRSVSFVDGTETKTLIMNTSITNNSAAFTASATSKGAIELTAAGGECKIGLIQITLDDGFSFGEVTEYTWTLDTAGLTNVPAEGLDFGNTTTTSLSNTLSYSGTDYVLKDAYETISDSTDGVTVDGTNVTVKPTDDWFDVVAPKNYVSVEPTVDGNTTVYNFVQADNTEKYLISVNDASKSATTAYADFGGKDGTDNDCYVILSTEGAKLYDDSATAAAKLVIPYSASEGKVTVSGSVTPTNNIGGKWKLVDLGCVSVSTDNSKNIVITNDNSADYKDNAGVAVKGQTVTYSVTIDFASKTASGTVTNGATTKEFTNVPFETVENMGSIAFTTNNGNSVSSGNDRALTITSVTITAEEAEVSPITKTDSYNKVAVLTDGTNNYVVSVVSSSDVASYDLVSQYVSDGALNSS